MDPKIAELRRLISEGTAALRAMVDKAEGDKRGLNDEEKTAYEAKKAEVNGLQERLKMAEEVNALPTFDKPAAKVEKPEIEGRGAGNGAVTVAVVPEQRTVWNRETRAMVTRNRGDDEVFDNFGDFLTDVRTHALTGNTSEKLQTDRKSVV